VSNILIGQEPLRTSFLMSRIPKITLHRIVDTDAHMLEIRNNIASRDIGIYIHVPYCRTSCLFCPYFRTVLKDKSEIDKYFNYLLKEIDLYGRFLEKHSLKVIELHVGGGTPSIVPGKYFKKILEKLSEYFNVETSIGLEANPEDLLDLRVAEDLYSNGVDEISLGIQSFSKKILLSLGRKHTPEDNMRAIENCLKTRFNWVNIDLMFLPPDIKNFVNYSPGEKLELFKKDLLISIETGVDQVTYYATIIPSFSPGGKLIDLGRISQEGEEIDIFIKSAIEILSSHKMYMTRIYSFSREKYEYATVNLEMIGPLIGFGAGAWSNTGSYQYINTHNILEYSEFLNKGVSSAIYARKISRGSGVWRLLFDQLFTAGRMSKEAYKLINVKRFPTSIKLYIQLLKLSGLVRELGDKYVLTEKGVIEAYKAMINYIVNVPIKITNILIDLGLKRSYPSRLEL